MSITAVFKCKKQFRSEFNGRRQYIQTPQIACDNMVFLISFQSINLLSQTHEMDSECNFKYIGGCINSQNINRNFKKGWKTSVTFRFQTCHQLMQNEVG